MSNKFIFGIVAVILLLPFIARGGAAALMPLGRFILVGGLIYFAINKVKQIMGASMTRPPLDHKGTHQSQSQSRNQASEDNVIDMCPRCGSIMGPRHKCT